MLTSYYNAGIACAWHRQRLLRKSYQLQLKHILYGGADVIVRRTAKRSTNMQHAHKYLHVHTQTFQPFLSLFFRCLRLNRGLLLKTIADKATATTASASIMTTKSATAVAFCLALEARNARLSSAVHLPDFLSLFHGKPVGRPADQMFNAKCIRFFFKSIK